MSVFHLLWWRHQMETFSALLTICAGNSPVPGEFPTQMPVTRSFNLFFDLRLNKRLSKQSRGWWFETLSRPLWRHRNDVKSPHWDTIWNLGYIDHEWLIWPVTSICWLVRSLDKNFLDLYSKWLQDFPFSVYSYLLITSPRTVYTCLTRHRASKFILQTLWNQCNW